MPGGGSGRLVRYKYLFSTVLQRYAISLDFQNSPAPALSRARAVGRFHSLHFADAWAVGGDSTRGAVDGLKSHVLPGSRWPASAGGAWCLVPGNSNNSNGFTRSRDGCPHFPHFGAGAAGERGQLGPFGASIENRC